MIIHIVPPPMGLVGSNWEQIYKSYATGNVTGLYTTGGFVGANSQFSLIEDSYSTGNVIGSRDSGNNYFGGFVGSTSGAVKNCVSTGTLLPGWSWNGGFAGYYDGSNIEKDIENSYGNSTDCLGNTIKGLGNVIDSTNPDYDKYMAVGVPFEDAKGKLNDILGVILPEIEDSQDKLAVKNESAKYIDRVIIPNTVPQGTDITKYIVKLKEGMDIDPEISLVYSQKEYTGYITDRVPAGQYTLIKQNETENNETATVTIIFIKNGEFESKDIEVIIQSTLMEKPEEKLNIEIISDIEEIEVEGEVLLKTKVTKGAEVLADKEITWSSSNGEIATVDKDGKLTAHKAGEVVITAALVEDKNIKDSIKIKVVEEQKEIKIEEAIEELRKYYTNKNEFTFREALGYNHTSNNNTGKDLRLISSKFKTNESPKSASDHVGNIMGLIAAGKDPYNHNGKNYVEALADAQNEEGKFIIGEYDDYPTTIAFSILALDMADANYNRDKAIEALLCYQKAEGSFGGVDETGMVITALAKYRSDSKVNDAIEKGLSYLKGQQDSSTGGFIVWGGENPYSAATVIQGLIAVGEDPLSSKWTKDGKTMVDSLMNFYKDGHFEKESEWGTDIDMITEQAFTALADLYREKSMFHEIKVSTGKISKIVIDKPNIDKIIEGDTIKLYVVGYDKGGNIVPVENIIWSSSNIKVAQVDKTGKVTTKKPGNVTITAEVEYENIKDSVELEIHEKKFEMEYIGDTETKNGQQFNAKIEVENLTEDIKPATLIVVLYDKSTNRLLDYSVVKEKLKGKEELELAAGFLVPETGDYYIKVFLWDDIKLQNIIMKDSKNIKVAK